MTENSNRSEIDYRHQLANDLIQEKDKTNRKEVLNSAKQNREYWESCLYKVFQRRNFEGLENNQALLTYQLLKEYQKNQLQGEKLYFQTESNKDVYNISQPLEINNQKYIVGRVESHDEWAKSHAVFFLENNGIWVEDKSKPMFELEDPFWTKINDQLIFGGVKTWRIGEGKREQVRYKTVFYQGKDINQLKEFAESPVGMKDIRLINLKNGNIGVFTRPRRSLAEKGKIGFFSIESLDQLTAKRIISAKILDNKFISKEWGGVNQTHLLENGRIGVIGHISAVDNNGNKHYYAMSFIFDPETFQSSNMKIIATREDFSEGFMKVPDISKPNELADVIFPGGIIRNKDGTATLYCGLSDSEAGKITIKDPFKE